MEILLAIQFYFVEHNELSCGQFVEKVILKMQESFANGMNSQRRTCLSFFCTHKKYQLH